MRYPFVYISDVKDLPPESRELLLAAEIDCMVVDALFREKHFSHFSLGEALSLIREVSQRLPRHKHLSGSGPKLCVGRF